MSKAPPDRKPSLPVPILVCLSALLSVASAQTPPQPQHPTPMTPEIQWANLPAQPIGANDLVAVSVYDAPRTYPHRARQRRWLHPPSHTQTARHIDQQVGQQAGNRDGRGRVPFKFRWRRYSSHRRAPDRCPGRGLRASCIAPSTPRACLAANHPPVRLDPQCANTAKNVAGSAIWSRFFRWTFARGARWWTGARNSMKLGVPRGIRTPVTAVKGRCPRPG